MKRFYYILGGFCLCISLFVACEEAPEEILPNQFIQVSEATGNFNRFDPDNTAYSFTITANPPPELQIEFVQITKRLNKEKSVELLKVNQFPAEVRLTLTEAATGAPGADIASLTRNDQFSLYFYTKAVGKPAIYRTNTSLTLTIECPVNLGGKYLAQTKGRAGPGGGGDFDNVASEVTITDLGSFRYKISDISGGMFTAIWGGDPQPAEFEELCREIQVAEFTDQWGDTFNGSGQIRADGSLTIYWRTSYGDIGTTELTPL